MPNILALDPALAVGWAHTNSPGGVWHCPDGTRGERFAHFAGWLTGMLEAFPTDLLVYERAHHRGGDSTRLALGWQTEIERLAFLHNVELRHCHTATLKKHATGSGRATKGEMLLAAKARNPTIEIEDDNHCDALFLLDWAATN